MSSDIVLENGSVRVIGYLYTNNDSTPGLSGVSNQDHGVIGESKADNHAGVLGIHNGNGDGIAGNSNNGNGIFGFSTNGVGVSAESKSTSSAIFGYNDAGGAGISATSTKYHGISGLSQATDGNGVMGENSTEGASAVACGVFGVSYSSATGVSGQSRSGIGVSAQSSSGIGVSAESDSNTAISGKTGSSNSAIFGFNSGSNLGAGVSGTGTSGPGVVGTSNGDSDPWYCAGVFGNNTLGGNGVSGSSNTGYGGSFDGGLAGVSGTSNTGHGGSFRGALAPLRLVPSKTSGGPDNPSSGATHNLPHFMGEFYIDNQGILYFCTQDGTPGTWKTVQLV
jgi:hypothetical protein